MSLKAGPEENGIEVPYIVYQIGYVHIIIGNKLRDLQKSFVGKEAPYRISNRKLVFCLVEEDDLLFSTRQGENFVSIHHPENMHLLPLLGEQLEVLKNFYAKNRYAPKSIGPQLHSRVGFKDPRKNPTSNSIIGILDGPRWGSELDSLRRTHKTSLDTYQ